MLEVLFTVNITMPIAIIIFATLIICSTIYLLVLKKQGKLESSAISDVAIILVISFAFLWLLLYMGTLEVRSYGFAIIVGFLLAVLLNLPIAKKLGIKKEDLLDISITILISSLIGSRILYVIITPNSGPLISRDLLTSGISGMSFHGGLILSILAVIALNFIKKIPVFKIYDLTVPIVALTYGFGRIGCFLNHCCFGRTTEHHILGGVPTVDPHLWEYPVQLYSTAMAFIIFVVIYLLILRYYDKIKEGTTLFIFLLLMGIERFVMEIYRFHELSAPTFYGLSLAQIVSISLIILSVIGLIVINLNKGNRVQ